MVMMVLAGCGSSDTTGLGVDVTVGADGRDASSRADVTDEGAADGEAGLDVGARDTGLFDTGLFDTGMFDAGASDTGARDAEPRDTGLRPLTYWDHVYPIVFERCAVCHAADERDRLAGIPPIVTYADTQAPSSIFPNMRIAERMAARVLNAQGLAGDMPMRGSPEAAAMTREERLRIVTWVADGAHEGIRPDGGVIFPDAGR